MTVLTEAARLLEQLNGPSTAMIKIDVGKVFDICRECLSLAAEVERLKRDADRLDWLDRDDVYLNPTAIDGEPRMQVCRSSNGDVLSEARTIREAIDAARAGHGE